MIQGFREPRFDCTWILQHSPADFVYASRVHIRRTDKVGTEAAFHPLEEYMAVVDEYYNLLEMKQKLDRRRVYLASDDPKVIAEAQRK